ncbi:MAG: SGNH/GDSL hydrolase family protein [Acidobacteriota bacterium]|nr:SGNH/GDSL hydrolase family protein [Acidobacteriota bacterium]
MTRDKSPSERRSGPIAWRALAVLTGLAAALILGELALRLQEFAWQRGTDPITPRSQLAGGVEIRRWGDASSARFRILIVGDSFTWGPGVHRDETYPAGVAAQLSRRFDSVEVMAVSRRGWNSIEESLYLQRNWEALAPDLFVLGYCLNDSERVPMSRTLKSRPELLPWAPEGALETWLEQRSALYSRTRRALDTLRLRPLLRQYYRGLYEKDNDRRVWRRSLARIRRLAKARSIPSVIVIFPIFDFRRTSGYAYREIHALVSGTASDVGFEVLDLLPAYDGIDGRRLALVPFTDPHPSAEAHAIAARQVAEYIENRELLTRAEAGR